MPGHADESITVHFGYGRTRAGKVANGSVSTPTPCARAMRSGTARASSFTRKSRGYAFATTQHTQTMEERDPFRVATFAEYHQQPAFANPPKTTFARRPPMFPLWDYNKGTNGECRST